MAQAPLFNPKRPRLLRQTISGTENLVSLALAFSLIGIIVWVLGEKDNYDPNARDVSVDMLTAASTDTHLYTPPLKTLTAPTTPNPAVASAATAQSQFGVFPVGIFANGWQLSAKPKQFGPDTLFEKINGEAPKFLKQGFQTLHYVKLKNEQADAEIAIELFDQGNVAGSSGVFAQHKRADAVTERHESSLYFRTAIGAIGRVGGYFYRITGDADTTQIQDKAVHIAQALALLDPQRVADSPEGSQEDSLGDRPADSNTSADRQAPPPETSGNAIVGGDGDMLLAILRDKLGIPEERISFQAENVFQYDFAHDFWFGQPDADHDAQVFVHQTNASAEATTLLGELEAELVYDYDVEPTDTTDVKVFKHKFLGTFMAIAVNDATLFGIENSATAAGALDAVGKFQAALLSSRG